MFRWIKRRTWCRLFHNWHTTPIYRSKVREACRACEEGWPDPRWDRW